MFPINPMEFVQKECSSGPLFQSTVQKECYSPTLVAGEWGKEIWIFGI